MKFVIDTERKLIVLEENVNLSIFVDTIKRMLGEDWSEYKLEKTTIFEWIPLRVPTLIQPIIYPSIPTNPFSPEYPQIICYDSSKNISDGIITVYDKKT